LTELVHSYMHMKVEDWKSCTPPVASDGWMWWLIATTRKQSSIKWLLSSPLGLNHMPTRSYSLGSHWQVDIKLTVHTKTTKGEISPLYRPILSILCEGTAQRFWGTVSVECRWPSQRRYWQPCVSMLICCFSFNSCHCIPRPPPMVGPYGPWPTHGIFLARRRYETAVVALLATDKAFLPIDADACQGILYQMPW